MAQEKTPGVYIEELNAFPTSVVEVATAVPAFIGYTEKAERENQTLKNKPLRIASFKEYLTYFGGPPPIKFSYDSDEGKVAVEKTSQFLLYYCMRLFFDNGGGPCWITSVGNYHEPDGEALTPKTATELTAPLEYPTGALCKEQEPTMIVVPDAVLLGKPDWAKVASAALAHCEKLQSRVAILDVWNGLDQANSNAVSTVINDFREGVGTEFLNYGVAYYPWLNTSIVESVDVDYSFLEKPADLQAKVDEEAQKLFAGDDDKLKVVLEQSANLKEELPGADDPKGWRTVTATHRALAAISPIYLNAMNDIQRALNKLPPSAGMAGVYTRVDNTQGVFKAPANTSMSSVVSPTVNISHDQQEDLNVPVTGKAVNAIRTFPGRGVLVWGARTLDGNSQDWRYINVRRTMIMLEQSIKFAAEAYVFEPNTAATWVTVRQMIGNFLNNKWKEGALAGATPEEAYSVDVGLGSTMTANDILDGYMLITVKVAIVRPAEFIVITFQQKMQTS